MAILKSIETNYGVEATYWRVMHLDIQVNNGYLGLKFFGWVNQEAADAGKEPLDYKSMAFSGAEFQSLAISLTLDGENVYNALKRVCELKALESEIFTGGTQI